MNDCDLAIIGGGPGGYVAAIRAGQEGLKTILIEKEYVGGTCLNVGCIPTKTLVKNAEILHEIQSAPSRGILTGETCLDMPMVQNMKRQVISQITEGVGMLLKASGVTVIQGEARVLSNKELVVNDEKIKFKKLIVATGSRNSVPPIPGLDEGILTSTEALELDEVPKDLVIIGGGVIGCEFATIYSHFGSKVTIIEAMPRILPLMDKDISENLKTIFQRNGIKVHTDCVVTKIRNEDSIYTIEIEGSSADYIETEKVLLSVGRTANLEGLESLGLQIENRYIKVDDSLRTSVDDVYAIGDVTGKLQLAHVASAQGLAAVKHILTGKSVMKYDVVPSCVYTIPEVGSVGLTEAQAREQFDDVIVGIFPMMACGKAVAAGAVDGFTKLIGADGGKLVGAHIVGKNATEVISEAAAYMSMGGTLEDIANTIHAHPTISETVLEAAEYALDKPIHFPKKITK